MKLLDSNIVIYAVSAPTAEIESMLATEENAVASVTRIGVYGYPRLSEDERSTLDILFDRLTEYPLDVAVVEQAIALRQQKKMSLGDAIIAATAIVHKLPLVTRNTSDFQHVTELKVINPFAGEDAG